MLSLNASLASNTARSVAVLARGAPYPPSEGQRQLLPLRVRAVAQDGFEGRSRGNNDELSGAGRYSV